MNGLKRWLMATVMVSVGGLMTACAEDQLAGLAEKMEKGIIKENAGARVAVLSFPYLDGRLTEGSALVQERLITSLAENGRVTVVERELLDKVLAAGQRNGMTGEALKEIGARLGVDIVVTGALNDLSATKTEINARAVHAQSGRIVAAGNVTVKKEWDDAVIKCPVRPDPVPPVRRRPVVQIALLLDTSGSMEGLLNQAKTQLWRVVNELASCRRSGEHPVISVALFEYGNTRLNPETGYIRRILPLTADLDEVSRQLFSLTTCGGNEYCGQVIRESVNGLAWDRDDSAYKAIFIAGNEPFTQGSVYYRDAIEQARRSGIYVNTIFCGNYHEGVNTCWKDGADVGRGEYMVIDHNAAVVAVRTPYDDDITRCGSELNGTFIPYGARGMERAHAQARADSLAESEAASGAILQRSLYKAKAQYSEAASWDAVAEAKKSGVQNLSKSELPPELAQMSDQELARYIDDKEKKRKELQDRIQDLERKRQEYLAKNRGSNAANSLDVAILNAVKKQAGEKKFIFVGK